MRPPDSSDWEGSEHYFLTKIRPERNQFRWYSLDLRGDMFGGFVLERGWGRIGQAGRKCSEHFRSLHEGRSDLLRRVKHRKRRGYTLRDEK